MQLLQQRSACRRVAHMVARLEGGDRDARVIGDVLRQSSIALGKRRELGLVFQRIARRHQPPEPVEAGALRDSGDDGTCPSCGGLNEPPNRPIVMPRSTCGISQGLSDGVAPHVHGRPRNRISGPRLPGAAHQVFERGQLLDADRAARMELAGRDADLARRSRTRRHRRTASRRCAAGSRCRSRRRMLRRPLGLRR